MTESFKNIEYYFPSKNIVVVKINRPQQRNALDTQTLLSIDSFLKMAETENIISTIIFTGSGEDAFISGGDIAEMSTKSPIEAANYSKLGHKLTEHMTSSKIVTIAAINGYAFGGGLEFALACDIRIASDSAQLGLPEVTLGAVCGFGGSQRLPRTIGISKATEMLLTGRPISASEALSWGLVSQTMSDDQLLPTAIKLAEDIVANSPKAVEVTKQLLHQGLQMDIHSSLALEHHAFWAMFSSPDPKEGMKAFLEKRPPKYVRD